MGRCGGKIPAAGRAMTPGFVVSDRAVPERDRPGFAPDRTGTLTTGAGLLGSQGGGPLFEETLDRPPGHGTRRALGDLLDVVGIEVEVGTDLFLDASRHDFAPSLGDALDPGRIHQRRLAKGIGCPSLDFGHIGGWEFRVDILPRHPERANRGLHPGYRRGDRKSTDTSAGLLNSTVKPQRSGHRGRQLGPAAVRHDRIVEGPKGALKSSGRAFTRRSGRLTLFRDRSSCL